MSVAATSGMICPDCPVGRDARAMALETFWLNAALAVLPFAVTLLVVWWLLRRLDRPRSAP